MRDHPMIEQIERTGYPLYLHEEIYECEKCERELWEDVSLCADCEEE